MDKPDKNIPNSVKIKNKKHWFNIRRLRLSLKYRPEIFKLVLKMRRCIREKNILLKKLNHQVKKTEQRTYSQDSAVKNMYNQDLSDNLLKNNGTLEQEVPINLTNSQKVSLLKLCTLIESNLDENLTDKAVISFDKSTFCESNVRDSFSQTKSETSTIEYPEENIRPIDILDIGQTDTAGADKKEAFTQTEYPFEESKALDVTLTKSGKSEPTQIDSFTQTEDIENGANTPVANDKLNQSTDKKLGWTDTANGDEEKSIAEQVKEVAQNAMQQSGMVYVESAGMYYDYKTGYYYNSELGLYYHTDTGCYYYYSEDQKTFVFHSYPERSTENQSRPAKPMRKSKILKKDEEDGVSKPKQRRLSKQKKKDKKVKKSDINKKDTDSKKDKDGQKDEQNDEQKDSKEKELEVENKDDSKSDQELEDGECSDSSDEKSDSSIDESDASTATASDDDTVAKHHPPCMRVIVRETSLPKLKVGSLFLITKDGGTVGREGEQHAILLKDYNVSRNHLDFKFDGDKRIYMACDLGSKNGTILNGVRMSESQEVSEPMEIVHGSTLQLGETKLLCHIHAGNDTCGHCEPGLIMEAEDNKKIAYTRTCSVQVQHQLELARLKNKYAPQPLEITDFEYNDRAQARREKVGSSHHAEKTQSSDLDTAIAADNKGFKLLEKMGWSKGEGLGKESQGDTEPIPLISNEGKSGLGASPAPSAPVITSKIGPATLRLAARTKMLQPPAKAFQQPADDDSE